MAAGTLVGASAASSALAAATPRAPAGGTPSLSVTPSLLAAPGISTTMAPAGISVEYPVLANWMGGAECPPPALVSELRRLGSPPIEVAGNSQDMTAPAGALASPQTNWERATLYQLPAGFWTQLHCLLASSPDAMTVGLNMRRGEPAWAQRLASEALAADPAVSFSLSNEPDLYRLPNYAALTRPLPEEEAQAVALYTRLAGELRTATANAPVIAPEVAHPPAWRHSFGRLLATVHPQTVGVHLYPLSTCLGPHAVTINGVLSESAAQSPARLAWVVSAASAVGAPAVISEANSASCGGQPGVSNSPAAAVWAVRFVLSALHTGFREVRFHSSGNAYDPFLVSGGVVTPRPLEAALVALNSWMPTGSTVASVHSAGALRVTLIRRPGTAAPLLVLDNESTAPQPLSLRWSALLHAESINARLGGVHPGLLRASHGQTSVSVPAQSVLAVSPSSGR